MKKILSAPFGWATLYSAVLTLFTAFVLLDAYVIPKEISPVTQEHGAAVTTAADEAPVTEKNETAETLTEAGSSSATSQELFSDEETSYAETTTATETTAVKEQSEEYGYSENSYRDENISISVTTKTVCDTKVYIADVEVSDISFLKTAFAKGKFGRNITGTTSDIADENNAVLAINGDYCGFRNDGFVVRNGVLYRDTARSKDSDALVIYSDGSFGIVDENEVEASQLLSSGAVQVFSFGPALIENGNIGISTGTEVSQSMTSNPRTAIGIISPLHYIFVVSDGRTDESAGLSLYELAQVMQSCGCTTAYNLDGGGSSTMYFNGKVVNNPTTNGNKISERKVSDIVYIGN